MKLKEIFWNLDKGSTKWSGYFDVYEKHLSKFIGKEPRILEIGVLGGGSIEMWQKYFGPDTAVIGVDVNPACLEYKYDGDVQIHRIESGDGPKLKMKIEKLDDENNKITFTDDRKYTINLKGDKSPKTVEVPINKNGPSFKPFKKQKDSIKEHLRKLNL